MKKKSIPIENLVNFQFGDDHLMANGKKYIFYRYSPPNISIMTETGIQNEIAGFARVLDILQCPLSLFITDKVEDYSEVRDFYSNLSPNVEFMTSEIVSKLDSLEVEGTSVQRSFYFVYQPPREDDEILSTFVSKGYTLVQVLKPELAVLMRNYMLREFISTDIYTIEQDIEDNPKYRKKRKEIRDREILRAICPHRMDFNIFCAEQNNFSRKTIMLKNFPSEIPPSALLKLATIRGTTFNMRLTPMDKGIARKMTDQQIKNKKMMGGHNDTTKQIDSALDTESIISFYSELARNQNAIYHANIFVEIYGKNNVELEQLQAKVVSELAGKAITHEELRYEQLEAFSSVQPLGYDHFLKDSNNMPSTTVAALYPCSYSFKIDKDGMILGTTIDGGNMILDFFKRSRDITVGNFTVTGGSGQGKSYLMKKVISLQVARGTHCYALDPEDEYIVLYKKLGGTVINCADGKIKINPFEVRALKTTAEDEEDEQDNLDRERGIFDETLTDITTSTPMFMQHLSWLSDYFQVLFPKIPDETHKCLMIFVQDMYKSFSMDENTDYSKLASKDYPTFSSLYEFIEENRDSYGNLMTTDNVRNVLLHLKDCHTGSLGALINGHTNIGNHSLVCFSLGNLLEGSKERTQAVLFNITTYIWNIISHKENNIMLTCDELYLFLENEMMAKYFHSFVKRCRKYDAILGIGTQQLADCLEGEHAKYASAIFANSPFKFLFHPGEVDMDLTQKALKLNDGEMRCISKPNQKQCLVKAGNSCYHMEVGTYDYEEDLFGKAGGK